MNFLSIYIRLLITSINAFNEWLGRTVAWLSLVLVLVTFTVVLLRYCFNIGWIALQESTIYLHVLIFMLGSAYTLKQDKHVRVDIIYQHCSVSTRAWIDFFGCILLLLPVSGFMLWSSWTYVMDAWEIHEGSRHAGGLPAVYLLKSIIPIMAVLLILQGTAMTLENFIIAIHGADTKLTEHG